MAAKCWLEEELKVVTRFLFQTKLDIKDTHPMGEDLKVLSIFIVNTFFVKFLFEIPNLVILTLKI